MDTNVRNFYEEENKYEDSIVQTKTLVEEIVKVDLEQLSEKIKKIDSDVDFDEYINMLEAVIGKDTNNFYYCKDADDQKYHDLIVGNVYSKSMVNPEIQSRIQTPKQLELPARALLAKPLYELSLKLKDIFQAEENIMLKKDIVYLENLTKYLALMLDEKGRLKILVAEQDVFALNKAKEQYQKKSSLEKWFLKAIKQEKSTIDNMAKKNKERR